ncbi:uncharacterized protein BO72DRAFT_226396 [Aspergillus fijiensis CBS 313.89]|uniref:Uncharacterized protein n=1 Tax=Aspergillus fijiensis CBS 313.89 TaxID=1448319 RepID=A0A8G1RLY4_9EURO|nr:uncharacterized protein BO72DRAFT_226396 [Aspergillus fijiensis CBS 313.89]RAK73841.1 hypothetical protein BO72DRAFT_226396 [Aspergillus fijiensis CBS 313.89]
MVDLVKYVLGWLLLHLGSNLAFFILMHEQVSNSHCSDLLDGGSLLILCLISSPHMDQCLRSWICRLAAPVSLLWMWITSDND